MTDLRKRLRVLQFLLPHTAYDYRPDRGQPTIWLFTYDTAKKTRLRSIKKIRFANETPLEWVNRQINGILGRSKEETEETTART